MHSETTPTTRAERRRDDGDSAGGPATHAPARGERRRTGPIASDDAAPVAARRIANRVRRGGLWLLTALPATVVAAGLVIGPHDLPPRAEADAAPPMAGERVRHDATPDAMPEPMPRPAEHQDDEGETDRRSPSDAKAAPVPATARGART